MVDNDVVKFQERVRELHGIIKKFLDCPSHLDCPPLRWETKEIMIEESGHDPYPTNQLLIYNGSDLIATLNPVGFRIISAVGRVDIIGKYSKEPIVYLLQGGPSITSEIKAGDFKEQSHRFYFKGVEKDGWYWVGNPTIKRAYPFNEQMFFDLLDGVSDYAKQNRATHIRA